jgi:hypothetical protein
MHIPWEGSLFPLTSCGPMEATHLIGMCSVLVLGAIGGIGEGLVAAFVLTDIWFLSSVRSQVRFQVF